MKPPIAKSGEKQFTREDHQKAPSAPSEESLAEVVGTRSRVLTKHSSRAPAYVERVPERNSLPNVRLCSSTWRQERDHCPVQDEELPLT